MTTISVDEPSSVALAGAQGPDGPHPTDAWSNMYFTRVRDRSMLEQHERLDHQ